MKKKELKSIFVWATMLSSTEKRLKELAWELPDSKRYKQFSIPKSNGGIRIISEPIWELKYIQEKLLYLFEKSYEPEDCSHGFVRGKSILTNARKHVRKSWVLNMDIEKFFPTIHIRRVEKILTNLKLRFLLDDGERENAYKWEDVTPNSKITSLLANLLCFRSVYGSDDPETFHGLPQGAPTSPIISDMVAHKLDKDLMKLSEKLGLEYTRYADDISFSPVDPKDYNGYEKLISGTDGKHIELSRKITKIFAKHGFKINPKKTKLFTGKSCKSVTGLTVNEFVNVPRKVVRSIREHLFLWEKHGYSKACDIIHSRKNYRHKKCPKRLVNMLHGNLLYLSMVRGKGDPVYLRFVRRFRILQKRDLINNTQEGFKCTWSPDTEALEKNGDWKKTVESSEMRFRINLEDFPLRSAKHFAGRRRIFLENEGDLRAMLRTEVGAWAYERLEYIFNLREKLLDEFTYDPIEKNEKCLLEYMLEAEAAYLHVQHDELIAGQAHDKWVDLFFRMMEINGELCSNKFLDPAFSCHIQHIDWGTFFRHQNDEFLSKRYGFEKFDVNDLISIASTRQRRISPCASLMLWTALAPMALNAKDCGLVTHRKLYKETLEATPNFFPLFDDVLTSCSRTRNGNPPSMSINSLRAGVLLMIRAFGAKPISQRVKVS